MNEGWIKDYEKKRSEFNTNGGDSVQVAEATRIAHDAAVNYAREQEAIRNARR